MITGAGRGIGRAIGEAMSAAGAHVTLVARTGTDLDSIAERLRADGGQVTTLAVDVTDDAALEAAMADQPTPDVLVNSAGFNRPEPFADVATTTLDAMIALNLRATFVVSQLVVRRLLAEGRPGVIINITSQMGHVGAANRTVYCATKHAVEGLTKAMAVELGPRGIRVVSIAPTFVDTPMTRPYLQGPYRDEALASIPIGRFGEPEEVAAAAVFLAGPSAGLITGTSLLLDGGWTAR